MNDSDYYTIKLKHIVKLLSQNQHPIRIHIPMKLKKHFYTMLIWGTLGLLKRYHQQCFQSCSLKKNFETEWGLQDMAHRSKYNQVLLIVLTSGPIFIARKLRSEMLSTVLQVICKARLGTKMHFGMISQDRDIFFVLQAAEKLNCCLFVHPWDMQIDGRMSKYWFPWLIGESIFTLLNLHLWTVTGLCPDCCKGTSTEKNYMIFLSIF